MKAAVLHGIRDIRVEEVPAPSCGAGEVLVRIKAVGVCGSDVHSRSSRIPSSPGTNAQELLRRWVMGLRD
jgi:threonine dehydrogenase-like Zn-dependent dehydrogenase